MGRLMYITFALSLLWRQWRERNTVNDPAEGKNISQPKEEQVGHAREEESTGSFEADVLGTEKKERKTEDGNTEPQKVLERLPHPVLQQPVWANLHTGLRHRNNAQ